jgi:hypothetical protein
MLLWRYFEKADLFLTGVEGGGDFDRTEGDYAKANPGCSTDGEEADILNGRQFTGRLCVQL